MPCNVDIATQEILKLAVAADPEGTRTMGVLTKPDLALEKATRGAVLDLVRGKRSNLKLGYTWSKTAAPMMPHQPWCRGRKPRKSSSAALNGAALLSAAVCLLSRNAFGISS